MRFRRRRGTSAPAATGSRRLALCLTIFACSCAFVVQSPGWAQTSYMALSRALSGGTAQIDRWHWETKDIAYTDGHYYSVKPPGLALATLPLYAALDTAGAGKLAARRAHARGVRRRRAGRPRTLPTAGYGFSAAARAQRRASASPTTRR